MAGALRAVRAGTPGGSAALIGIAFLYGLLHAIGPGHGKVLIGAWSAARPVGLGRLLGVTFAASMAQAAVAVGLVYAGLLLLGMGREALTGLADGPLTRAGTWAVLGLGLWLVLRGVLGLVRPGHGHDHDHEHDHHPHLPDPRPIAGATRPAEVLALIAAVAIRPCTGALFLLILTWQMGLAVTGILGTFAMGLGTFAAVAAVALLAGVLRRGTLGALAGSARLALALPLIEIAAGLIVAITAALVLARRF
jgi:ABC-type nickel/cobalt efflux system permease component RcnA